jgi:phosphate:Na+ symporter
LVTLPRFCLAPAAVSPHGAEELSAFHKRTADSLRIAFGVFTSGDVNEARKLLAEKALLRNAELAATEHQLDRLRDLRRIHSDICSVAYPVLDDAGELAAHRKAENEAAMPATAQPSSIAEISCWRRTAVR